MVVNSKLSIARYQNVVDDIVEGYFNASGEYRPDLGRICEMIIFIRECVQDEQIDVENICIEEMDNLLARKDLYQAFDDSFYTDDYLSFGSARQDAFKIINHKKSIDGFLESVADKLINAAISYLDKNGAMIEGLDLNAISEIYKAVSNNKNVATAIVDAYGKSDRFKQVVSDPSEAKKTTKTTRKKTAQTNRQKVVPMEKKK